MGNVTFDWHGCVQPLNFPVTLGLLGLPRTWWWWYELLSKRAMSSGCVLEQSHAFALSHSQNLRGERHEIQKHNI